MDWYGVGPEKRLRPEGREFESLRAHHFLFGNKRGIVETV